MKDKHVYRLVGRLSGTPERKVYSRFQLAMKLASLGRRRIKDSFRVERAPVGNWQDVTDEFLGA